MDILIRKSGCALYTTVAKFNSYYKRSGYEIVKEETYDLDSMSYKELQELYGQKFDDSPVGKTKADILERLNEVL